MATLDAWDDSQEDNHSRLGADPGDRVGRGDAGSEVPHPEGERLQKLMAAAGVASRRRCEELIVARKVRVDGVVVDRLGTRVDPAVAVVEVDGERIEVDPHRVHLAFHKPLGVLSTMDDPQGRISVADYLTNRIERLYHVGRLDADTEGLLIMTNDGAFAERLSHPRYEVPKTYLAEVVGPIPRDIGLQLRTGVELDDGMASVDAFRVVGRTSNRIMVEVVLHEGRNRIVRRLLAAVGLPVTRLIRTRVGPVALGDLRAGTSRTLTAKEISSLWADRGTGKPTKRSSLQSGRRSGGAGGTRPPKPGNTGGRWQSGSPVGRELSQDGARSSNAGERGAGPRGAGERGAGGAPAGTGGGGGRAGGSRRVGAGRPSSPDTAQSRRGGRGGGQPRQAGR